MPTADLQEIQWLTAVFLIRIVGAVEFVVAHQLWVDALAIGTAHEIRIFFAVLRRDEMRPKNAHNPDGK